MKPLDALVIGAGITGLVAGFRLQRRGLEVAVLESSERVGGVIETDSVSVPAGEFTFELGPNTVLDGEPEVRALLRDLGLAERVRAPQAAARRRYLFLDGRLVPLPSGPLAALRSPILSLRGKLRLFCEPFLGRARHPDSGHPDDSDDETVAAFVRRRLGGEALTRMIDPLVSGIYAGDAERLSLRWAFPRLAALEQEHGSLVRGAFARRAFRPRTAPRRGELFSFPDGLSELPRRLAERVGDVRTGCAALEIKAIERGTAGYVVSTPQGDIQTRRVVVATSAQAAASLLDRLSDGGSRELAEIPFAPVAVVSFGFARSDVAHPLDGFGVLVPRGSGLRLLGCVFASTVFAGRAPESCVALTVFLGGRHDPELVELEQDQIGDLAERELGAVLGISGPALVRRVQRWPRGIPQLEQGHQRFVATAERIEREVPGLALAGNWRHGVSVPNCIQAGETAAARLVD